MNAEDIRTVLAKLEEQREGLVTELKKAGRGTRKYYRISGEVAVIFQRITFAMKTV